MIKRVTAILLAGFLIFALSIPVFAESSVTIPVSGAWHFNDTLDFSSLSSNLTETVNFLSDGVPYTSMLVTSSSLSYSRSAGSVTAYGDDSVALYSPAEGYTNYMVYCSANYQDGGYSYKYGIVWFKPSTTYTEVISSNSSTSMGCYIKFSELVYYLDLYSDLDTLLEKIRSSETTYHSFYPYQQCTLQVNYSFVETVSNPDAILYSNVDLSDIPIEANRSSGTSTNWQTTKVNFSANHISDNEVIKIIGQEDDSSGGSAGFADPSYKTIQFGNTPQEVSAEFYSWLIRNASPAVSSIEDANGDGYDDESYDAGEQAGYTVGYADGQASSDSYDLGYSIGYDTGYNDGLDESSSDAYDLGYSVGYDDGYNVGKGFSQNQESDSDTVSNFFVRFLGAVTSFLLYLGINISYRGVTILTILFFVIIAVLVWFLIRKLGGKGS